MNTATRVRMNSLSLVESIEVNFNGNILKNAICLGDCDNDGNNELIIGNCDGDLAIFRYDKCVGGTCDLGTISAMAVGDLLNINRNMLVVVTIEGWCHVFDVEHEFQTNGRIEDKANIPPMFQINPDYTRLDVHPFHSQRIPPNSKTLHLGDVNGDGLIELVVGLTDRVLRTYQWRLDDDEKPRGELEREDDTASDGSEIYEGRLYGMNKWEFANQIGSVSLHQNGEFLSILVAQPGGTVTQITEKPTHKNFPTPEKKAEAEAEAETSTGLLSSISSSTAEDEATCLDNNLVLGDSSPTSVIEPRSGILETSTIRNQSPSENILIQYHSLNLQQMQNPNISTEVIGNVSFEGEENCYAVATIDGNIIIAKENEVKWSLQVENQILSLSQINGNLIVCTWNGDTYLINKKIATRFHFDEGVAAFVAGSYAFRNPEYDSDSESESAEKDRPNLINRSCFAYFTFQDKMYIYPKDLSLHK